MKDYLKTIETGKQFIGATSESALALEFEGPTILENVSFEERELWWEMYDKEFAESNLSSPCRQSFYKDEFHEAVDSPDMTKLVYFKDGIITSVCLLSNNLDFFPWLSKEYYQANFPEDFENKNILYFVSLLTKEEFRRQDHASKIINLLTDIHAETQVEPTVIFDCTAKNALFLPEMIGEVIGNTGLARLKFNEIGKQHYYAGKLALNELREDG